MKIRPQKRIDIPYRVKWLNNSMVNKYIGDEIGKRTSRIKQEKWFDDYLKDKNKRFFTILFNDEPVGLIGFSNISKQNKNADLFVVIGEDNYRGKGIGRNSMSWLIDFGFNRLGLHKINLGVVKDNIPAVSLYKRLGFKVEGEMEDELHCNGKFYNFLSMSLFKKNYKK